MLDKPQNAMNNPSAKKPNCPSFKGFFRLTSEKRVRIVFPKRNIPPDIRQLYFGRGYFEMQNTFDLPGVVLQKLGLDFYRIPSGFYVVQEDQDFIRVDF